MLAYDPDAVSLDDAKQSQAEAVWRRKEAALEAFNGAGACDGLKDLIVYAVGTDALIALKNRFIDYVGSTPK